MITKLLLYKAKDTGSAWKGMQSQPGKSNGMITTVDVLFICPGEEMGALPSCSRDEHSLDDLDRGLALPPLGLLLPICTLNMWGGVIANGPFLVPQLGSIVEHQETISPLLSLDGLEGEVAWSIPRCCRLRELPCTSLYLLEDLIAWP